MDTQQSEQLKATIKKRMAFRKVEAFLKAHPVNPLFTQKAMENLTYYGIMGWTQKKGDWPVLIDPVSGEPHNDIPYTLKP